jgi:hypothetical protein
MILYCDVENCIYNEHGKCDAGKVEIVNGECEAFVKKESEVEKWTALNAPLVGEINIQHAVQLKGASTVDIGN